MLEAILRPRSLVEILLLSVVFYFTLNFIRGTRGAGVLKGLIFLFIVGFLGALYLADLFELVHIKTMMTWIISASAVSLIVIFAPEMRRGLARIAQSRLLSPLLYAHSTAIIEELTNAVVKLSKNRIGALIAVERDVGLGEYVENAVKVDARLTSELLETVFYPGSALHDGAVIIQHDRVAAAGCLFPLTDDPTLSKSMGTRHRAAIGISEETDAIVIVVSEETGRISVCVAGKLTGDLGGPTLTRLLEELYTHTGRPTVAIRRAGATTAEVAAPAGNRGTARAEESAAPSASNGPVSENGSEATAAAPAPEEKKP